MRYAYNGDIGIDKHLHFDVVIVGAGLAGLYTALNIDEKYSCCVLSKEGVDISNSWLAQGGIAAAIAPDDSPILHFEDTIIAGAGLCDEKAVHVLVDEGPEDIKTLVSMHVPFDVTESGELQITLEGGHRKNRIVHAGGDATGREAVKVLAAIAAQRPNLTFVGHTLFMDVLTDENGAVCGALVHNSFGGYSIIHTRNVVICTGGIGQVYKSSTNPVIATGDGIAAAQRAGAVLKNLEFIQFHPTGLYTPDGEGRAFLISEAVRGEGGLLKNREGVRFMLGAHELNELAPRDIVARAIVRELEKSGEKCVYLDITARDREFLSARFPTIYNECLRRGIDISRDWIPVRPVQHYMIGGIATDLYGQTAVPGLYACGEAAYTGVHGANRLASNSMLECLVFGRRAAQTINQAIPNQAALVDKDLPAVPKRRQTVLNLARTRDRIQQLMNDYGGVIRNRAGMETALTQITAILTELESSYDESQEYVEALNIATVAKAILTAALARKESVGAHYRED